MAKRYFEENIGKLGYGNMRLPRVDGKIDTVTINSMIDRFLAAGFSYFDTAYVYGGSEEVLRESLVKRYPRDQFQIATKMALMSAKGPEGMQEQLDTSLSRLGVEFIDFYLLHGLNSAFIKLADEYDAWGFLRGLKEKGVVRYIGFSFHGTPEELEMLLEKHPYIELVQLQINYLDWENPEVQSRRLYEIARAHDAPISVMEPNKGGWLAGETSESGLMLKGEKPDASVASWAFRFLLGLDGILTILSGVGTVEEVEDNIKTFKENKPLSGEEYELIKKAVEIINGTPSIPCTGCNYCTPHCPQKINIPGFLALYNQYLTHKSMDTLKHINAMMGNRSESCLKCAACEKVCPQHLKISVYLEEITELVRG